MDLNRNIKQSPIIGLAGAGGGTASYILYGTAPGGSAYEISRSMRFDSGESTHFSKTFGSGNRKTFTWSGWLKSTQNQAGSSQYIFGTNDHIFMNRGGGEFDITDGSDISLRTERVFRDYTAWYHLVVAVDTTIASPASDRVKIYVNGTRVTDFATGYDTYPSQDFQCNLNTAVQHSLGNFGTNTSYGYDGYMADVHFVDGSQLTPDDFGELVDGNWNPKRFAGSHGSNGFYLKFDDPTSLTTLGNDSSGGGNNWTLANAQATSNNYPYYVYAGDATYNGSETSKDFYTGNGYTLFDGTIDAQVGGQNIIGSWLYFRPASAITGVTSLEVYGSYNQNIYVNGVNYAFSPAFGSSGAWITVTSPPSSITEIAVKGAVSSSAAARLRAIKINGVILKDGGTFGTDSSRDTPTVGTVDDTGVGGELIGNYCTINSNFSDLTLTEGNLKITRPSGSHRGILGTVGVSTGRWYWEMSLSRVGYMYIGVGENGHIPTTYPGAAGDPTAAIETTATGAATPYNGTIATGGSVQAAGTFAPGATVGLALDLDSFPRTLKYYNEGSLISNLTKEIQSENPLFPAFGIYTAAQGDSIKVNFGQTPFIHAAPSGHKCLNTANLPSSPVGVASTAFNIVSWSGDAEPTRTITGAGFEPDLMWTKCLNGTFPQIWIDNVRTPPLSMYSHTTDTESSATSNDSVYGQYNTFTSDGFTMIDGSNVSNPRYYTNNSGNDYIAWLWNADKAANPFGMYWQPAYYTKYIGWKLPPEGGTIAYGLATSSGTGDVYTSRFNDEWTRIQQNVTLNQTDSTNTVASGDEVTGMILVGNPGTDGDSVKFGGPGSITGSYTMEVFVKAPSFSSTMRFFSADEANQGTEYTQIRGTSGGQVQYYNGSTNYTGGTLLTNVWNHIALVRDGSSVSYYLNGKRLTTASDSSTINITNLVVGHGYGNEYFDGEIYAAKFTNGQALYSGSTYTVPTAAVTTSTSGSTPSNVTVLAATTSNIATNQGTSSHVSTTGTPGDLTVTPFGTPFILVVNTSDATWGGYHYAMGPSGADAHYSTATYPGSGASFSWAGPGYTDWDFRAEGTVIKTGGLDSTIYNQTARWSDMVTGTPYSGSYPVTNAFDGRYDTRSLPQAGTYHTFTPSSPITINSSLRVYLGYADHTAANALKVNGTDVSLLITVSGYGKQGWIDIPGVSTLTSMQWLCGGGGSEDASMALIEIDGKILVDDNITPPSLPNFPSTVVANKEAGFSVVSYIGNETSGQAYAHGLDKQPELVISKNRTASEYWMVWAQPVADHEGDQDSVIFLNVNNIAQSGGSNANYFNGASTHTVRVGSATNCNEATNPGIISYCFHSVPGYQKIGRYKGNSSASGTYVECGFRPRFIMIKCIDNAQNWIQFDTTRGEYNIKTPHLHPNLANVQVDNSDWLDITATGFKLRANLSETNGAYEYLFYAVAESPFKSARAR